jgi:hypothetical protein
MHIAPTRHEHGGTAKVYVYEADYAPDAAGVYWTATVRQGAEWCRNFEGSLPMAGSAVAAIGEQAVRDEIIRKIDALK